MLQVNAYIRWDITKAYYEEIMLNMVALDVVNGLFLIALAIVYLENDANCHWFLSKLQDAIDDNHEIISIK